MIDVKNLKVGDVIVRFGQIHKIFEIGERNGKKMIFYKRLFVQQNKASSTFSIPQENVEKAKIRIPLSKKEMDHLLGDFLESYQPVENININTAKGTLNTDDPEEIIQMLKNLTFDREIREKFPFSKREVYDTLIKRFTGEVAYVYDLEREAARAKIEQTVKKSLSSQIKQKKKEQAEEEV